MILLSIAGVALMAADQARRELAWRRWQSDHLEPAGDTLHRAFSLGDQPAPKTFDAINAELARL